MGDEWIAEQGIPVVSQRAKEAAKAMEPVAATLDGWQRSLTSAKEQGSPLQRLRADPIGAIPKALFEAVPYMAAAATGPAGVAGVAASRAGQEYRRMTGEGVAPEKARVAASLVGTAEAILERIVPSRVLKGIDKDLIGRVISQSGMEAGTEFLQHFPVAMADLATGLREGSLTRQDFYGALEDALMGGVIGGVAGVATGRPSATGVDAEIRQRLRDRVVIGEDATAAGAKDVTESAFSRFYRHFVDKQHPVEINSEIEHAVERSRGAPMIARVPFELGIFETDERGELVRDPATNSPVQLARPLTQILKGVNQDHLRTLLVAQQDIELSTQEKAGTQAERSLEDLKLLHSRLGADGLSRLQGVAGEFRDWLTKATIDPLVQIGMLTPDAKAAMLAKNQFYSPMVKVFEAVDDVMFTAGSRQFQGMGKPIKGRETSFGAEGKDRVLDPLEVAVKRVVQVTKFVEKQRVANLVVNKFKSDPDLNPLIEELGGGKLQPKDSVFAFENGERKFYRLPEPIMNAINDYTGKQLNFFTDRILAPMSRLARAGFTYAMDFAAAATLKDQWEAYVYSPGINPVNSFVPGIGLLEGVGHMVGKTDLYKEYMQSGSGFGSLVAADRKDVQQLMEIKIAGTRGQKIRQHLNPLAALQAVGNQLSEASRLGIFSARKRAGETTAEARHSSRYALTDFRRMGQTGEQMNAVVAFWNAQMQGLDKFARTFNPAGLISKDGEARKQAWTGYTKALASVTLPSLLLWAKNQKDEDYNRLPTWEKNAYWHVAKFKIDDLSKFNPVRVFLGKANPNEYWLRIPKPFELGWVFGSLPERMLDYAKTQHPGQLAESLSEFGGELLPGVLPTAAMPFIENAANHKFFFGGPVTPHGTENQPPEAQYTARTPQLIRDTAGAIGGVPGLGGTVKTFTGTDPRSPAHLENLVHGLTGTMGMDAVNAADALAYGGQSGDGLPLDPRRLPIFRRFTSPADPNLGAQPIREMFNEVTRVDGLASTISGKAKNGHTEEATALAKKFPEYKGATWLRRRRQAYLDQRKVWERVRNSKLGPEEKQRQMKVLEEKMVKTAEVTLAGWREFMADLKE